MLIFLLYFEFVFCILYLPEGIRSESSIFQSEINAGALMRHQITGTCMIESIRDGKRAHDR